LSTIFDPRPYLKELAGTYNGSRKMPNLVLALALAREGVPVLLHGAAQEPQRVDSFAILSLLGHAPVASVAEAEARLNDRLLAAAPLSVLSGPRREGSGIARPRCRGDG